MLILLAAIAAPRATDPVGEAAVAIPSVRPTYRTLSRTSRFGFGFEVGGGGVIGPSIDLRLVGDLWMAIAVKPRVSWIGSDEGENRLNAIGTLAFTYPLFTVRRWSFRAKAAIGGTIPLIGHFESVATLAPSFAFWTRRGVELSWSIGPGLFPYRNINGRVADWQGFLYFDFALRFHFDAEVARRRTPFYEPVAPAPAVEPDPATSTEPEPEPSTEPETPEDDNDWAEVLEGSGEPSD